LSPNIFYLLKKAPLCLKGVNPIYTKITRKKLSKEAGHNVKIKAEW